MSELGSYAIVLALAAALWGVVASIIGATRKREDFVRSAEGAVYAMALAVCVAAGSLLTLLVTGDFSVAYVADYTSKSLAVPYRFAAMWAGQGGSLLLWAWIVSLCAAWITYANRIKSWQMSAYTTAVFAVVAGLFAVLVTFFASPFAPRSPSRRSVAIASA